MQWCRHTVFSESRKTNLCERIAEIGSKLPNKVFGETAFGTVVIAQCARKFIWLELAWRHFKAAWSTADYQFSVNEGTYSPNCALFELMP